MNLQDPAAPQLVHVAISGWYGHHNLGDDAILHVLVTELGCRLSPCVFTVITDAEGEVDVKAPTGCRVEVLRHPPLYRLSHARFPSVWARSLRTWRRVAAGNLFILGGGGLLRDNFPRSNLLRLLDEVLVARLAGVPVALFAVGAGPFVTRIGTALVRRAVRLARSVTVRDRASAEALRTIGVPMGRVRVEADPALLLPAATPAFAPPADGGPHVAICPSRGMLGGFAGGAPGNPRLVEILAETALRLAGRPGTCVWLVPFCRSSAGDDDVALCEQIRVAARRHPSVRVAPWLGDPRQVKGLLQRMDLVIGARLHALILGIGAGVPCVAINYEPKVAGFMAEMNLSAFCVDPPAFDPERAVTLADRARFEWPARSADVAARVRAGQDRMREALDRVAGTALADARRRFPGGRPAVRRQPAPALPRSAAVAGSVSVIIPAYNAERYIADAIESALGQTLPPYEIIVVDDGSTDGTADVVRRYGEPVRLLLQRNRGPAAARNRGLMEARGEFVAFLDADDVWTRRNLELQVAALTASPRACLSYGRIQWFSGRPSASLSETEPSHDPQPAGDVLPVLVLRHLWATPAVVVRRGAVLSVGGFDDALRIGEDYDLWLRLASGGPVAYVPYRVAACRVHGSSATQTSPYYTTPPEWAVIRRCLHRVPGLRECVGARELRRRASRCHLNCSLADAKAQRLAASLLHACIATALNPPGGEIARAFLGAMARQVVTAVSGDRNASG